MYRGQAYLQQVVAQNAPRRGQHGLHSWQVLAVLHSIQQAITPKQFMWQPDLIRVAQFLDAGVRRMRDIGPSDELDVQSARLAGTYVLSCPDFSACPQNAACRQEPHKHARLQPYHLKSALCQLDAGARKVQTNLRGCRRDPVSQ